MPVRVVRCPAGTISASRARRDQEPSYRPMAHPLTGIDPADLETCLRVLSDAASLDADHPDSVTVQRAVGHMFKKMKRRRRNEARDAVSAADRAVVAATATGSPDRIDRKSTRLNSSHQKIS